MQYPTIEQVEAAGITQITAWNRSLPSPMTDEQIPIINRIFARLGELKAANPAAGVAASKAVGWGR